MSTDIVDNPHGYRLPGDMIVKDSKTLEDNLKDARGIVKRRLVEHQANYVKTHCNIYFGKSPYNLRSKKVLEIIGKELEVVGYTIRIDTYGDGALELVVKWSGEINE
jgi:hypothetical protein